MKVYQFIVLLVLVVYINSKCEKYYPESEDDCFNATLSDYEKAAGGEYCCHLTMNNVFIFNRLYTACTPIPKDYTMDRIEKDSKEAEKIIGQKLDFKYKCRFDQ